jgi:hypothetical protein
MSVELRWNQDSEGPWRLVSGDGTELASVRIYGKLRIDDLVFSRIYICESPGKISFECQILERSLHKCEKLLGLWTVSTHTEPSAVSCSRVIRNEHSYFGIRPVGYHDKGLVKEADWIASVQAPRFLNQEDAEAYAALLTLKKSG